MCDQTREEMCSMNFAGRSTVCPENNPTKVGRGKCYIVHHMYTQLDFVSGRTTTGLAFKYISV